MKLSHICVIYFLVALISCQPRNSQNPVAIYLSNAEIQCEGETQKANIIHALNDILTLSEDQLRQQRYKDYEGNEQQWDLPTLLHKHFVTDSNAKDLGDNLYHDIKEMEAQREVKNILKRMTTIKKSPEFV